MEAVTSHENALYKKASALFKRLPINCAENRIDNIFLSDLLRLKNIGLRDITEFLQSVNYKL